MIDEIKNGWDNIMTDTARHIKLDSFLVSKDQVFNVMYPRVTDKLDLKGKIIIDYGCGGGWLGKYFQEKNLGIKEYIGFDVSQKSIKAAKENNPKSKIIEVKKDKINFKKYNADIFICQYVIQHFPNKEYLDGFLDSLNKSNIPILALMIRYSPKNIFSKNYKTFNNIRMSCQTSAEYMLEILTNYKKTYDSGLIGNVGNRYYIFGLKK